jgi:hypothetical protein
MDTMGGVEEEEFLLVERYVGKHVRKEGSCGF